MSYKISSVTDTIVHYNHPFPHESSIIMFPWRHYQRLVRHVHVHGCHLDSRLALRCIQTRFLSYSIHDAFRNFRLQYWIFWLNVTWLSRVITRYGTKSSSSLICVLLYRGGMFYEIGTSYMEWSYKNWTLYGKGKGNT